MFHRLRTRTAAAAALAALLGATSSVAAQDSTRASANAEKPFCFRGRALPRCHAFAITEFGGDTRLYAPKTELRYVSPYDSSVYNYSWQPAVFSVTGEVGALYNTSKPNALGGTIFLRNGSGGAQFGVKARYRRWMSAEGYALDAAVGIANGDGGSSLSGNPRPGLTGDVAVNFQDFAALRVRVDLNRTEKGTQPALYAGVRAGSFPALGAAALVGTGFAVLFAIFAAAGGID